MQSVADLASFLVPEDRRFCSKATLAFLRDSKTVASDVTRWQASCTCEVPPSRFDVIPREGSNGWEETAVNGVLSAQGELLRFWCYTLCRMVNTGVCRWILDN